MSITVTVVIEDCRVCNHGCSGYRKAPFDCTHPDLAPNPPKELTDENCDDFDDETTKRVDDPNIIPDWCPLKTGSNY